MKIRIDGRELLVKKTTRAIVDLQRQAGWRMDQLDKADAAGYGGAMAAFFALHNAGLNPSWNELLDRDIEDFQVVAEPGDDRDKADAVEPPSSPADSAQDDDEGAAAAAPASTPSTKPKHGSKSR